MWALYNLAHSDSAIKSQDEEAWVRILGFFQTKSDALSHARSLALVDAGLEIRLAPAGEFRMMLRSRYEDRPGQLDMLTRQRETQKHAFLIQKHTEVRKEAFDKAADNAEKRQMGELKFSEADRVSAHVEEFGISSPPLSPPSALNISTPTVKKISTSHEIRMQRFAAIAVIPDYEHSNYLESVLETWEKARDAAYTSKRNYAIVDVLGDRSIPPVRELLKDWIILNPPPRGYNVWGQQIADDIWIKSDTLPSNDSEVRAWINTFKIESEKQFWKWLGSEPPDRAVELKAWIENNPIPSGKGAEPAVAFLRAAETESELREWITSKSTLRDVDIACVAMYEWIKIQNAWSPSITRTFRNPMVAKLHEKKDFQHAEAMKLSGNVKEIEINN